MGFSGCKLASRAEEEFDSRDCNLRLAQLALPNSHNFPSHGYQRIPLLRIAKHRRFPLVPPKIGVRRGGYLPPAAVVRVPKTSVYEDRFLALSEREIWFAGEARRTCSVSIAEGMKGNSQCKFWLRVAGSHRTHVFTSLFFVQDVHNEPLYPANSGSQCGDDVGGAALVVSGDRPKSIIGDRNPLLMLRSAHISSTRNLLYLTESHCIK